MSPTHCKPIAMLKEASDALGNNALARLQAAAHRAAIVWIEGRGMRLLNVSARPPVLWGWFRRSVLASLAVTGVVAIAACSGGSPTPSSRQDPDNLPVGFDSVRLPVANAYAKAHPNVHVNIVT